MSVELCTDPEDLRRVAARLLEASAALRSDALTRPVDCGRSSDEAWAALSELRGRFERVASDLGATGANLDAVGLDFLATDDRESEHHQRLALRLGHP